MKAREHDFFIRGKTETKRKDRGCNGLYSGPWRKLWVDSVCVSVQVVEYSFKGVGVGGILLFA